MGKTFSINLQATGLWLSPVSSTTPALKCLSPWKHPFPPCSCSIIMGYISLHKKSEGNSNFSSTLKKMMMIKASPFPSFHTKYSGFNDVIIFYWATKRFHTQKVSELPTGWLSDMPTYGRQTHKFLYVQTSAPPTRGPLRRLQIVILHFHTRMLQLVNICNIYQPPNWLFRSLTLAWFLSTAPPFPFHIYLCV